MRVTRVALFALAGALWSAPLSAQGMDSLIAAAQRAAGAFRQHDFRAFIGGADQVAVVLPGASGSAPLPGAQAAQVLTAFAEGALERTVEVTVARMVDAERAYIELRREFTARGGGNPRSQTVYLGLRRDGSGFRVAEVRIVP
jgi:hypothetical protein